MSEVDELIKEAQLWATGATIHDINGLIGLLRALDAGQYYNHITKDTKRLDIVKKDLEIENSWVTEIINVQKEKTPYVQTEERYLLGQELVEKWNEWSIKILKLPQACLIGFTKLPEGYKELNCKIAEYFYLKGLRAAGPILTPLASNMDWCVKCNKFTSDIGYASGQDYCKSCGEDTYDSTALSKLERMAYEMFPEFYESHD